MRTRASTTSWLGGFLAAQRTLGGAALAPFLSDMPADPRRVRRWMKHARPDVVIGFGPQQLFALRHAGFAVPRDVGFAALDVQQTRLADESEVAGIDQNLPSIGANAIELLAAQLYHNEHGLPLRPVVSMIQGYWVNGRTAPRRRRGSERAV